jgi:hypothetical protein
MIFLSTKVPLSLYEWAPIAEELKSLDRKDCIEFCYFKMGYY